MKNLILLALGLFSITALGGCLKKNQIQFDEDQLTAFFAKADLKAEQVFENLVEKKRTNETVSVFVKCVDLTSDHLQELEKLGLEVQKMGEDTLTLRGPAKLLPRVATFDFVKVIEGARVVKLRE